MMKLKRGELGVRNKILLFRIPNSSEIMGYCKDYVNMVYYVNGREYGLELFYDAKQKKHDFNQLNFNI